MGIRENVSVAILVVLTLDVQARPISYSGGSTLISGSAHLRDSLYYHYSPSYKYSIGLEAVRDKVLDEDNAYLRFAYLLDRHNAEDSQSNVYLQLGMALDGFDRYFYGIHGDWESRRWFVGLGARQTETDILDYSEQYLQLGVAPYIGDYGDVHTWLMVKTTRNTVDDEWGPYPVVRIFKGSALFEAGYDESQWDVRLVYRF